MAGFDQIFDIDVNELSDKELRRLVDSGKLPLREQDRLKAELDRRLQDRVRRRREEEQREQARQQRQRALKWARGTSAGELETLAATPLRTADSNADVLRLVPLKVRDVPLRDLDEAVQQVLAERHQLAGRGDRRDGILARLLG